MDVRHGGTVLITDGRKALLLRNDGDSDFPNLRMIRKWQEATPADRELKSDSPGRAFGSASHGTRRSSYDEPDLHALAEVRFAAELADYLNNSQEVGEMVIVAPPRTLGDLRRQLDHRVAKRVTAEITKDLVKHPIAEIERLIMEYQKQP